MTPALEPGTGVFSSRKAARPIVATAASAHSRNPHIRHGELWRDFIDTKLIEWGAKPDYFDAEDFDPSTVSATQVAVRIATRCRDQGLPAPDRVVPDGDGGIAFEIRAGMTSETIHIRGDGTAEYYRLEGTTVVERFPLFVPESCAGGHL